jgi:hypothetical protein
MLRAISDTFNEVVSSIAVRGNNYIDDGAVVTEDFQIKLETIVAAEPFFSHCWMWI